jgi:hypothetical protein
LLSDVGTSQLRKSWIAFAATTALIAFGCTRHSGEENVRMGGQDPGGGSAFSSSVDEVNAALDHAIKIASEEDLRDNLVMQFWNDKGRTSSFAEIKHPLHLFPKMVDVINFSSPQLIAMSKNKLIRLPKGDCPHPASEQDADASVTSHSLDATICFSIGNLRRIAPPLLLREILSLVIHEATHMGGADEAEAQLWQREFYAYFGDRLGDLSSDDITVPTLKMISEAKGLMEKAHARFAVDPNDKRIFGIIGEVGDKMKDLPRHEDTFALKLKLNPSHPELIENYQAAIYVMTAQIDMQFTKYLILFGGSAPSNPPPPDAQKVDLAQKIALVDRDVAQVFSTFLAFSGAATNPKSSCLIPKAGSGESSIPGLDILSAVTNLSSPCVP